VTQSSIGVCASAAPSRRACSWPLGERDVDSGIAVHEPAGVVRGLCVAREEEPLEQPAF
jgi:hypothetical protein